MMQTQRALIDWVPEEQGGRTSPPLGEKGSRYVTVVELCDPELAWPADEGWSFVVEPVQSMHGGWRWLADVRFLVAEAPHHTLGPGTQFALYEGRRCVALGRILGDEQAQGPGDRT
jgi:hypothetical protein